VYMRRLKSGRQSQPVENHVLRTWFSFT